MTNRADWTLVLMDDEADVREVTAISLKDAGYAVHTAEDGLQGVELVKKLRPQIVITDVRMPKMDGLRVLRTVKALDPDIEVIVITAFGDMNLAIEALRADASDFVTKPVGDEALHLAVNRALERCLARRKLKEHAQLLEAEKVETTQELLRAIHFQRDLIEGSMDGILGLDRQNRVATCNRAMETLLGRTRETVQGAAGLDRFFDPPDFDRFMDDLASNRFGGPGRLYLYETAILDPSGKKIPVQVSARVPSGPENEVGLVCFFRDLRELRRLEREMADQSRILHQDKMMSLGRLAASVIHEINNPLAGVLNYLRLMRRLTRDLPANHPLQSQFSRYLELSESETARCSGIVSNLLSFSRLRPPSLEPVRAGDLLERCATLSRHKLELSNIELVIQTDPGLPAVPGDFNQLQQCVINLIFNAVDAMPQGGRLTLAASADRERRLVLIRVTDTGVGLAPEDLPRIFEPFYTTKAEGHGVGLGLSTVFGIMERHGGRIVADGRPGQGAAFTLELPVEAPPA